MDKEDVVHVYNAILLSHKKEQNFAMCSNMDELGGHHAKWAKTEKTNTVWYHLHVESKKYDKLMNITKKQTHRYREQTSGYQWGGGGMAKRGRGVGDTNYWV